MKKLTSAFFEHKDVTKIAKDLLGKILVTKWKGIETSGRIVECEAYAGVGDKASHAAGGRRTARNEIMYGKAGAAYVYLCYGIHHLFNVVTNKEGIPHAILVRALEPLKGIPEMMKRCGKEKADFSLTRGPGNVSKALGINTSKNGWPLRSTELYLADDGTRYKRNEIFSSPRIGVDYSGDDALLLYLFYVKGNPWVSGKPK